MLQKAMNKLSQIYLDYKQRKLKQSIEKVGISVEDTEQKANNEILSDSSSDFSRGDEEVEADNPIDKTSSAFASSVTYKLEKANSLLLEKKTKANKQELEVIPEASVRLEDTVAKRN